MIRERKNAEYCKEKSIDKVMAGMEDLKKELTQVQKKKHVPVWV